eukprot:CAMPEP_0181119012 /NCGR_PEP_ID=MMETSP1071-20121207/23379_1 /TAXON_ID=35127 /ORGANISM="Thalassiosira sp., Strain NH16" /LENGTH=124 /DNA_ID=CAMNT_0023203539 /DNA_START=97 /DNA_END=471 /DNA_ORIENTATION=+
MKFSYSIIATLASFFLVGVVDFATAAPSRSPSPNPSGAPSLKPSQGPSAFPSTSNVPSLKPSQGPSLAPSLIPSPKPSQGPDPSGSVARDLCFAYLDEIFDLFLFSRAKEEAIKTLVCGVGEPV